MDDLSEEERELAKKEEADIERRRDEASRAAAERGLADAQRNAQEDEPLSQAKEDSPGQPKQEEVDRTPDPTTTTSSASEIHPPKDGQENE
jgi:hypothetical protein